MHHGVKLIRNTIYKAERAGKYDIKVNPRNTSNKCFKCGNIMEELSLDIREYHCNICGLTMDRDELINIINNELSKIDVADLINTLNDYGVPCSKVNRISDVVEDKQINFRDMIRDFNGLKLLNSPIKMSETPGKIRKLPSKLGEDTYDILKNLGYTDQEIKAFKDNGTVK